jgi:hypothetical protein
MLLRVDATQQIADVFEAIWRGLGLREPAKKS